MTRTRTIVGTRMRQLRKTAGFSQDRLGRASDLSGKFIGEVERGEKSISLDNLAHLARALRVPLGTMLKGLETHVGRSRWGATRTGA